MNNEPSVGIYVPHGEVPDHRGFSPAIVGWNHAVRLNSIKPIVFCGAEVSPAGWAREAGVPILRLRESAIYTRLFRKWSRLDPYPLHLRAARAARRQPLLLWHAHQLEFPVAAFKKHLQGVPVIVHAHVTNRGYREERGTADLYLAVSSYVERTLVAKGYPASRIAVLPNGVDTDLFRPARGDERIALRKTLGLPPHDPIVLFAGRKQVIKGFDVFLAAAKHLVQRGTDAYFVAVGPEPSDAQAEPGYSERLRERAWLAASSRYREESAKRHEELASWFRASDILFVPSRTEPQGMVMIEGLAAGLVVISSNVGGIAESIEHRVQGLLMENPGDQEEAIACLDEALALLEGSSPLREAARLRAVRRYSWKAVIPLLEGYYRSLLSCSDRRV